eukprot:279334_1
MAAKAKRHVELIGACIQKSDEYGDNDTKVTNDINDIDETETNDQETKPKHHAGNYSQMGHAPIYLGYITRRLRSGEMKQDSGRNEAVHSKDSGGMKQYKYYMRVWILLILPLFIEVSR